MAKKNARSPSGPQALAAVTEVLRGIVTKTGRPRVDLLDLLTTPLLVLDHAGRIEWLNTAAAEMIGGTAKALRGRAFWDTLPDEVERARVRETLGDVCSGHAIRSWECQWSQGGDVGRVRFWCKPLLDADGRVAAVVATGVAGADGGAAEQALRESEEEHRVVLSNISDAVFITDERGVFTFICPNVDVIFRCSYAEVREAGNITKLLGTPLVSPDELERAGEIQNIEHVITDKQGDPHTLLVNVKRVAIRQGTRLYTCRDVTVRKQIEESLEEYRARLAHATRVSTVGEMTSGLAHELNQPLSAIANFSQACVRKIRAGRATPEDLLPHLEQVSAQAHRAASIIQRLRSLLRRRTARRAPADLHTVVGEALELVEPAARRQGVRVERLFEAGLPPVDVDSISVQQVVINLVRNALEACGNQPPPARHLDVTLGQLDEGQAMVSVTDRGPGLAAKEAERIFEPFFTTKSDGMGLGLSISKSIIEAHEGRLWAEPNPSGGTTFKFTLPISRIRGTLRREGIQSVSGAVSDQGVADDQ